MRYREKLQPRCPRCETVIEAFGLTPEQADNARAWCADHPTPIGCECPRCRASRGTGALCTGQGGEDFTMTEDTRTLTEHPSKRLPWWAIAGFILVGLVLLGLLVPSHHKAPAAAKPAVATSVTPAPAPEPSSTDTITPAEAAANAKAVADTYKHAAADRAAAKVAAAAKAKAAKAAAKAAQVKAAARARAAHATALVQVKAAAKAKAAAVEAARPKVISARQFSLIAKDPDAHVGDHIIIYGEVTQFDAATGSTGFRANVDSVRHAGSYGFYDYPTNAVLMGEASTLSHLVQNDRFKATVTVLGSYSYDTQIGGNTTVPSFQVNSIS